MEKYFLYFISVLIIVTTFGCAKQPKEYNPSIGCESITDFYDYYCNAYEIEPTQTPISIDVAKEHYVTTSIEYMFFPPDPYYISEYIGFKHSLIYEDEKYFCFSFDIVGYENLKFYSYISRDYSNLPVSMQTVFVDETLKDKQIEFSVGDSLEIVEKQYPLVQIIVSFYDNEKYFEIMDKNGITTYFINQNDIITSKKKVELY